MKAYAFIFTKTHGANHQRKCSPLTNCGRKTPRRGGGGSGPFKSLSKVQEIQRGQEAPHNGSIVLPKDVRVTPLHPKGPFNSILNARLPGGLEAVDGFPCSHPNLDGGHPSLLENVPRGVLSVKMYPASFNPEEVENETFKDV